MRIASDTPKIIVDTLKKVDVSKVPKSKMDELFKAGQTMINKYPEYTRSLSGVQMVDLKLSQEIPQRFLNLLSQINYSGLGFLVKMTAERMMLNWVKTNLPMRK